MPVNTESLDTLLRKHAAKQAASEVHDLFDKFESDLLNLGYRADWNNRIDLTDPRDRPTDWLNLSSLLARLRKSVTPAIEEQRGQDAVDEFIKKVATLQDQIDETQD